MVNNAMMQLDQIMKFTFNTSVAIEVIGWSGTVIFLVAYGANMTGLITTVNPLYSIINIIGSVCLITNATANRAYPIVVLEIAWLLISLYGLVQALTV